MLNYQRVSAAIRKHKKMMCENDDCYPQIVVKKKCCVKTNINSKRCQNEHQIDWKIGIHFNPLWCWSSNSQKQKTKMGVPQKWFVYPNWPAMWFRPLLALWEKPWSPHWTSTRNHWAGWRHRAPWYDNTLWKDREKKIAPEMIQRKITKPYKTIQKRSINLTIKFHPATKSPAKSLGLSCCQPHTKGWPGRVRCSNLRNGKRCGGFGDITYGLCALWYLEL